MSILSAIEFSANATQYHVKFWRIEIILTHRLPTSKEAEKASTTETHTQYYTAHEMEKSTTKEYKMRLDLTIIAITLLRNNVSLAC